MLSKKCASLLTELLTKKIGNHVDIAIFELYNKGLVNAYCVNKRIAYQTSTDRCDGANSTNYPIIINKIASLVELDKMFRMNYILSVSILKIGPVNINPTSIIFFIIGIILALIRVPIHVSTLIFLAISLPDICMMSYTKVIVFNYVIFIFPSFLRGPKRV